MVAPRFDISPTLLETLKGVAVAVHELNRAHVPEDLHDELRAEALVDATHTATVASGISMSPEDVRSLLRRAPAQPGDPEGAALNYYACLIAQNTRGNDAQRLDQTLVCDLHRSLMSGLLDPQSCGHYRQEPAFMLAPDGGDVAYWFPYHTLVPQHLDALHAFVDEHASLDPVLLAGVYYKQFLLIRPFASGNCRTALLACRMLLRRLEVAHFELLAFERAWCADPSTAHDRLWEQGRFHDLNPDFRPWLEHVATGVLAELERLATEFEARRDLRQRLKPHHQIVLAHLERHGSIADRDYAGLVDRAKATRSLDFRLLLELGLIERRGRGPAVYYVLARDAPP